jgi:hypothetical protein
MMACFNVSAQTWMSGFNYRKRITINKAQVSGAVNLINFQVLISITDPDLKYLVGQCNDNRLTSPTGLDVTFAALATPGTPLKYQIDSYDPATGTLICWVNMPTLTASGNAAAANVIYMYYGGNTVQDPFATNALATWTGMTKIWHLNYDTSPAASKSARLIGLPEMAKGNSLMNAGNFQPGKIGAGVSLNGINQWMDAPMDTSATFTISAWVKMDRLNAEQVLVSNDSTGVGGYLVKINADGKIALDTRRGATATFVPVSASNVLLVNQWYYFAIQREGNTRSIYINGKYASGISRAEGVGAGGRISIGKSKQNDRYFSGMIDELRVSNQFRTANWLSTEYNNQNDPGSFYVVALEEKNPVVTSGGYVFTGALSNNWTEAGNWNLGRVPEAYSNVVVKTSAKLKMTGLSNVRINQLTLETGAEFSIENTQLQVCKLQVIDQAAFIISKNSGVQFNGDVVNNGLITTAEAGGVVVFSGTQSGNAVSGSGRMRLFHLQVNLVDLAHSLTIDQAIVITGKLELKSGTLKSNGLITLAASQSQLASLMPIVNINSVAVVGDVVVEKYVEGSFPAPATARGWRLWSSPVFVSEGSTAPAYNLLAYKKAMYVTGPSGALNGFDDSPQNGNTIFTHDQSIAGTLTQKYIPVPTLSVRVPLGKGVYVYSRGSRDRPDAFKNQVLTAPFINPEAYTLQFTGKLFTGDLKVLLNSRNRKEAGDGFNLLGNPYASAVRWGSLLKENTTGFVWLFNPLNNAYDVSDDPEHSIPIGSGFFVKVAAGASTGSITFVEAAKVSVLTTSGLSSLANMSLSSANDQSNTLPIVATALELHTVLSSLAGSTMYSSVAVPVHRKLEAVITGSAFSQRYTLKLEPSGLDEVTDEDAASLGDGYVAVAGLSADNQKLLVDSRALQDSAMLIRMYVKGYATGSYALQFSGFSTFEPGDSLLLKDNYLNTSTILSVANPLYSFQIDIKEPQTQGLTRFSLMFKKVLHVPIPLWNSELGAQVKLYPNPFTDVINMHSAVPFPEGMQVVIRDMMGRVVLSQDFNVVEGSSASVNARALNKGFYIIELRDRKQNKRLKIAKIIKL